jgi:asparagine synthase (glutamine-hydrolysing)
MCGIVAVVAYDGSVSPETVDRGVATLHHRGPDGRGRWIPEHRRVGLGHARLSIIDLETGDQPIANEDERLWLVANGEFYDFERDQRELQERGHRLRTKSDSEIAIHHYEDRGTGFVHRLRGEFAFALWDERAHALVAVRDRHGIKPLYYAEHEGRFYLASEMKALFAMGVPARWDAETMYFGLGLRPPGTSSFAGVHSVPPGYYLIVSERGVRLHRYWDVDYPVANGAAPALSDDEYVAEFRRVLEDSVRTRLRADVPVACYLSGGLDSCAVLGLAQLHRSDPVRAFTLTFDHEAYDEGVIAREMAEHCGADFVPVPMRQDELADHFSDAVYHSEQQCINAHGVAKYLLSRAVRDAGFKVVLTGEGSDEILAGYPHFRRDMLLYDNGGQDPAEVQRLLRELEAANEVSRGLLMPEGDGDVSPLIRTLLGFTPSWLESQLANFHRGRALFDAAYSKPFEERDLGSFLLDNLDVKNQLEGRAPVHQSLYIWAKTVLHEYILCVLGDRMEMAHSIEGRVPFLDHTVAEQLRHVPVSLKIRGTTEKYILREATKDVITDTVYRRQKHPFLSPPSAHEPEQGLWMLVQDTLRSKVVEDVPFLDAGGVSAFVDYIGKADAATRTVAEPALMSLLSAVFLHQRMGVSA